MKNLQELVLNFRRVMECLNPSDFVGTSLSVSKFPSACCDDSSQILAAYLTVWCGINSWGIRWKKRRVTFSCLARFRWLQNRRNSRPI